MSTDMPFPPYTGAQPGLPAALQPSPKLPDEVRSLSAYYIFL